MENGRRAGAGNHDPYRKDRFRPSGPFYLTTNIDWRCKNDRKSIAASLVNGVYILDRDRHYNRQGPKALAQDWWISLKFQLYRTFLDEDGTYFGAIFEYKGNHFNAPKYVLAFRGTSTNIENLICDFKLNARLLLNLSLARGLRYQTAIDALYKLVSAVGPSSVWIAGHSLGAALALQLGKRMAMQQCYIETYLFNPPYSSFPIETIIESERIKNAVRVAKNLATVGLCHFLKLESSVQHNLFLALCPWIPNLFVHQRDLISCGYIGYFHQRKMMESIGLGGVGDVATKTSMVGLVLGAMGKDVECTHLIPSAYVTKSMRLDMNNTEAHGLSQWWDPSCGCHSQLHKYMP